MHISRRAAGLAAGVALAVGAGGALAPSAQAASKPLGTKSLASILLADKSGFDHNDQDFDVLAAAVKAVLKAKPKSAVGVLADGRTPVTAFLPNDRAFKILVSDIAGKRVTSERAAFNGAAGLGINTVEAVLLYHVVPGATIDARTAVRAKKATLKTAQGGSITVYTRQYRGLNLFIDDADKNDRNPRVIKGDINKGNRQIAHAINYVLRPVNLP
jgi:uncharacterized surface protein with fasciclin (FAS1) repeats